MKKIFSIFFVLVVVFVIGEMVYFFNGKIPFIPSTANDQETTNSQPVSDTAALKREIDARTRIYEKNDTRSRYPGAGLSTIQFKKQVLVVPSSGGKSFFGSVKEATNYLKNNDKVFEVNGDDNALVYAVGKFSGWEPLEGTKDKLIVLTDPHNDQVTYKYRVAFEKSDLFGENSTGLAVENTRKVEDVGLNTIESLSVRFVNLEDTLVQKMFKIGDTVIVTPVFETPNPNKKDDKNRILASAIIIRREDGKRSLVSEIGTTIN